MPPTQPHQTAAYMSLSKGDRTVHNKAVRYCAEHGGNTLSLATERDIGIGRGAANVRRIGRLLDAGVWQVARYRDADGEPQYGHRIHDPRIGGEQ